MTAEADGLVDRPAGRQPCGDAGREAIPRPVAVDHWMIPLWGCKPTEGMDVSTSGPGGGNPQAGWGIKCSFGNLFSGVEGTADQGIEAHRRGLQHGQAQAGGGGEEGCPAGQVEASRIRRRHEHTSAGAKVLPGEGIVSVWS